MPSPRAVELLLSDEEREQLQGWARRPRSAQALAQRSRIVLAAAEGLKNTEIAERLGIDRGMAGEVALAVRAGSPGWATGRAAAGTAAHDQRRAGRAGDRAHARDGAEGRDPLVDAVVGGRAGAVAERGRPDLAGVRAAAAPAADLAALSRPTVRRQGAGRGRALSRPARAGGRALRRCQVAD